MPAFRGRCPRLYSRPPVRANSWQRIFRHSPRDIPTFFCKTLNFVRPSRMMINSIPLHALPKLNRAGDFAIATTTLLLLGLLRTSGAVPVVTSDRAGLNGTTPAMAFDASTATYFRSSYNDWQYLQVDF